MINLKANKEFNDYLVHQLLVLADDMDIVNRQVQLIREGKKMSTPTNLFEVIRSKQVFRDTYDNLSKSDLMRLGLSELSYSDFENSCENVFLTKVGKGLMSEAISIYILSESFVNSEVYKADLDTDIDEKVDIILESNSDSKIDETILFQVKTFETKYEIQDMSFDSLYDELSEKIIKEKEMHDDNYYHIVVHINRSNRNGKWKYVRDVYILDSDFEMNLVHSFVGLTVSTVSPEYLLHYVKLNSNEKDETEAQDDFTCNNCCEEIHFSRIEKDNINYCSIECLFNDLEIKQKLI